MLLYKIYMSDVFSFAKKGKKSKNIYINLVLFAIFFIIFIFTYNRKKETIEWAEYTEKLEEDSDNEIKIHLGFPEKLIELIEVKKGNQLKIRIDNDNKRFTFRTHGFSTFTFSDNLYYIKCDVSGIFWYEIIMEDYIKYGAILVKDDEEHRKYRLPSQERVLMLNGDLCNEIKNGNIQLRKNEPTTLYIVNCGKNPLKFHIKNHDFLKIGGDIGLNHFPIIIKEKTGLVLSQGERSIVSFVPRKNNIQIYSQYSKYLYKGQKTIIDETGYLYIENINEIIKDTDEEEELEEEGDKINLVNFKCIDNNDSSRFLIPTKLRRVKKIKTNEATPIIKIIYDHSGNIQGKFPLNPGIYIFHVSNMSKFSKSFTLPNSGKFQHLETRITYDGKSVVNEKTVNGYGYTKVLNLKNPIIENKDTIYIPPLIDEIGYTIVLSVEIYP